MHGSSTPDQAGIYGTQTTPDGANAPGSRYGAIAWTDSEGLFWLFGGGGYDSAGEYGQLNDLWN